MHGLLISLFPDLPSSPVWPIHGPPNQLIRGFEEEGYELVMGGGC